MAAARSTATNPARPRGPFAPAADDDPDPLDDASDVDDSEADDGSADPPGFVDRFVLPVVWFVAVLLIAAGAAGLLGGMDHPPGTAGRVELTWDTDRRITPALDDAAKDLSALSIQVDQLTDSGRHVLTALTTRNATSLGESIAGGSALEAVIVEQALAMRGRLEALPVSGQNPALRVSPLQLARHKVALQALGATEGIESAWSRLVTGSTTAARLMTVLADHDATMARAATQGVAQAYADAVITIAEARSTLAQASTLRTQLANTTNVSTLDQWVALNTVYDNALDALYKAFVASRGKVTQEVSAAFAAQEAAKARLPPDSRSLVVIMAEISQGGLNQAVIAIDQAGQQLAHSLESMPDS